MYKQDWKNFLAFLKKKKFCFSIACRITIETIHLLETQQYRLSLSSQYTQTTITGQDEIFLVHPLTTWLIILVICTAIWTTIFVLRKLGVTSTCQECQQIIMSNQKAAVSFYVREQPRLQSVSQIWIRNKRWILGMYRRRPFPGRCGSDVTTQAELPVCQALLLTYYRTLSHHWSEDGQLSVDKKACVSLWTDACQSNCQAWTSAWFSPALWSCFACPPVASSVLLHCTSVTRWLDYLSFFTWTPLYLFPSAE